MVQKFKYLVLSKEFWKIQVLNALWIGRYYYLTCCKVIGSVILMSFFFEGLALSPDQKELFLKMVISLFYLFFIIRIIDLGVKLGMKSDADTIKVFLAGVRLLLVMTIFLRFGGLNVETYDSILQGFNQSNYDYLLENYGRYIYFGCVYFATYKLYYKRIFVSAVDVTSFKANQLFWNASDWIFRFVFPIRVKTDMYFGKNELVKVYFKLDYSWIQIGKYLVCSVRVGEEKEDVERDLPIQRQTNS